ncbi:MAG: DUF1648 domain-containing protein [Bacteroidia bacterium]|nr:DUF1648 domain-containing protein [Bacteroidia bacterium]
MRQSMTESPATMPMGRTDKLLELIGIFALVFIIGMPLLFYNDLPESIPRQFGFDGAPDQLGNKAVIWWLTCIGVAMYAALFVLERSLRKRRNPDVNNVSTNFEGHRLIMIQWLQFIRLFVSCLFAYIIYVLMETAMGQVSGFNPYFVPIVFGIVLGSTLYFGYMAINVGK